MIKLNARTDIVGLYYKGELKVTDEQGDLFEIPSSYKPLWISDGNEILIARDKLLFFTTRSILDNFDGYVYSPNGSPPTNKDIGADILEMRKMDDHWYFVSCT
ncbi:hypothetical protein ACOI1C_08565 [Bacillus sp. DJP31]|uniref:hypothetical protein n=1 Tax=Bacillus sp. DJP31 TaxID=3409789 RepID=UPI003BB76021